MGSCHNKASAQDPGIVGGGSGRTFVIDDDAFVKDGERFLVRAGSMHYFRVHPKYWHDRLQRMKGLGLNTLTTYIPWNFHEEEEGCFEWSGWRDVTRFLDIANEEGFLVHLRPGPYICAEWEMGGLPAWLLRRADIKLRTYEDQYISFVDKWWAALLPKMEPYLYCHGGPIVMVQLENEYGYVGDCSSNTADAKYMQHLLELAYQHLGEDVVYTTVDNPNDLHKGSPWKYDARVLATIDGYRRLNYSRQFSHQRAFNAAGHCPKMWSELWVGWFTYWRQKRISQKMAMWDGFGVRAMVQEGASFSIYMAHGGTNFGFFSGSNAQAVRGSNVFLPDITSYDYNAAISENGDNGIGMCGGNIYAHVKDALEAECILAEVYEDLKDDVEMLLTSVPWQMSKHLPSGARGPAPLPRKAYGRIELPEVAMLFDSIHVLAPAGAQKVEPGDTFPSMEAIGQNYGFILYRSGDTSFEAINIAFEEKTLHDRVQVFVDGHDVGDAYRVDCPTSLSVQAGTSMDLLVENMGRTNFGPGIYDYKGLMQKPPVSGSWLAFSIPLKGDQVQSLPFRSVSSLSHELLGPVFRRGKFIIAGEPEDTYFDTRGLDKGVIFINGFNLGRYWDTAGPQHALFVPAPLLKEGENEVIVLELHNASASSVLSTAEPRWTD